MPKLMMPAQPGPVAVASATAMCVPRPQQTLAALPECASRASN